MKKAILVLSLIFISSGCFKKEDPPKVGTSPVTPAHTTESSSALTPPSEENVNVQLKELTELQMTSLKKAKASVPKLSSPAEKTLVEKFLSYIENPSEDSARQFTQALVGLVQGQKTPQPLSFKGLFESPNYYQLSVRWSNWIEQGDLSAITALLVYSLTVQTDGAETETIYLHRNTVQERFSQTEERAKQLCREYFSGDASHTLFQEKCTQKFKP